MPLKLKEILGAFGVSSESEINTRRKEGPPHKEHPQTPDQVFFKKINRFAQTLGLQISPSDDGLYHIFTIDTQENYLLSPTGKMAFGSLVGYLFYYLSLQDRGITAARVQNVSDLLEELSDMYHPFVPHSQMIFKSPYGQLEINAPFGRPDEVTLPFELNDAEIAEIERIFTPQPDSARTD